MTFCPFYIGNTEKYDKFRINSHFFLQNHDFWGGHPPGIPNRRGHVPAIPHAHAITYARKLMNEQGMF